MGLASCRATKPKLREVNRWEAIDGRVLEWAAKQRVSPDEKRSIEFLARADEPFDEVGLEGLSGEQVDESLRRFLDDGRIEGKSAAFVGRELRTRWTNLRVTARGLIALREWLDLETVATATGVHALLTSLAESPRSRRRRPCSGGPQVPPSASPTRWFAGRSGES